MARHGLHGALSSKRSRHSCYYRSTNRKNADWMKIKEADVMAMSDPVLRMNEKAILQCWMRTVVTNWSPRIRDFHSLRLGTNVTLTPPHPPALVISKLKTHTTFVTHRKRLHLDNMCQLVFRRKHESPTDDCKHPVRLTAR
ncbi:hypothetical protein J6590_017663 [Homalodisca vitripennis]|nr:hypothetical protein J6590_017663 [Homalodisca vitripennis]